MKRRWLLGTTVLSGLLITCASGTAGAEDLTVTPAAPLTVNGPASYGTLNIGDVEGPAQMTVTPEGVLTTTSAVMGRVSAAKNSALINGQWTTDNLTVGLGAGENILDLRGEANVTVNADFRIGVDPAAANANTVDLDNGSQLSAGRLVVGDRSAGNSLTSRAGSTAEVAVTGDVYVGDAEGSNNNTLSINATSLIPPTAPGDPVVLPGGPLVVGGRVYVGNSGDSNTLNITGGAASQVNDAVFLGYRNGSDGNALNVSGANTELDITNGLLVGSSGYDDNGGSNNVATIASGAAVMASRVDIGNAPGSNNRVNVGGAGSNLSTGGMEIGRQSENNGLVITDGGSVKVTTSGLLVGSRAAGSANTVSVSGENSLLDVQGGSGDPALTGIVIGQAGSGNDMALTTLARVTTSGLTVGVSGNGNQVSVASASVLSVGTAESPGDVYIGRGDGATGNAIFIQDSDSAIAADNIYIGTGGGADSNKLSVTGSGSSVAATGTIIVGNSADPLDSGSAGGKGNQFTVLDGATASAGNVIIGQGRNDASGATRNLIQVSGTGSRLTLNGVGQSSFVGNQSAYNSLVVANGGVLTTLSDIVSGNSAASGHNVIRVTGRGSQLSLQNTSDLLVGNVGSSNSFTVEGGASASMTDLTLGFATAAEGGDSDGLSNSFTVTGAAAADGELPALRSIVTVDGKLGIGKFSDNNSGLVSAGAKLRVTGGIYISASDNPETASAAAGNSLGVRGAGSLLDATGSNIYIGSASSLGRMAVSEGAVATAADVSVNSQADDARLPPVGLRVDGAGTRFTASSLSVGSQSAVSGAGPAGGMVVVASGAELAVEGNVRIGEKSRSYLDVADSDSKFSAGSVDVGTDGETYGELAIFSGAEAETGKLTVASGSLVALDARARLNATALELRPGSGLALHIDKDAGSALTVDGVADVTGSNLTTDIGTISPTQNHYTVLKAGEVRGTFAEWVKTGNTESLKAELDYSSNEIYLLLTSALAPAAGLSGTFNANQRNVATAIDKAFNGGATLGPGLSSLYSLSGDSLGQALTSLSGEAGATAGAGAVGQATTSFLGLLTGGGQGGSGFGPRQYAAATPAQTGVVPVSDAPPAAADGWALWGGAYGGGANLDGQSSKGTHDSSTVVGGIATGWDYALTPDTRVGLAVAGGRSSWDLSGGQGSGDNTFIQLGGYGRHDMGAAYLALAGAYSWNSMSSERKVSLGGTEKLDADFTASNLSGRAEAGYRIPAGSDFGLTPYAAFQAQALWIPGYDENGSGLGKEYALHYDANTVTALRSELGLGIDTGSAADVRLYARAAWAHDWNSDPTMQASFVTLGAASFTVTGADAPDNLALVKAGAEFDLTPATTLGADFDGEFAQGYQSYIGSLTLRYSM